MKKFRILDYVFEGQPEFISVGSDKCIGVVLPADLSTDVIFQIQDANSMEILDPKTEEVIGTHRLLGWRNLERVYSNGHSGLAITWFTVNLDPLHEMQQQIEELETENNSLREENKMLENAVLELAEIIGGEEEDEE